MESQTLYQQPTAIVVQAESQESLICETVNAVSNCKWLIGQNAFRFTEEFGGDIATFAQRIDHDYEDTQRARRVWMRFQDHELRNVLSYSFFRYAVGWDDAEECLTWSAETDATLAELRAWRRAKNGEDLSTPAEDDDDYTTPLMLETTSAASEAERVEDESEAHAETGNAGSAFDDVDEDEDYTPFKPTATAVQVAPKYNPLSHSTRLQIEDFLNELTKEALGEAMLAIEGDAKEKADYLQNLVYELDPSRKPAPEAKTKKQQDTEDERDFEEFWKLYPRQEGKGQARRAYKTAKGRAGTDRIRDATIAFSKRCEERLQSGDLESPNYIPHPSTWLNGERWEDKPASATPTVSKAERELSGMADWLNKSIDGLEPSDEFEDPGTRRLGTVAEPDVPF